MKIQAVSNVRKLVITGALGALTVFLGITRLGFWPWFSGVSITVMHIPAIIGTVLEGPLVGSGIGAIFGLFSLLQAYINPTGPFDLVFQNPLVSVLPRIVFPLVTALIYNLLKKHNKIFAVTVSAIIGSLVHTTLVLGAMYFAFQAGIAGTDELGNAVTITWDTLGVVGNSAVIAALSGAFLANGVPEAGAAGLFSTLVAAAWMGISNKKKSRLSESEEN